MSQPAVKDARTETRSLATPEAIAGKPQPDHAEEHEESHGLDWLEVSRVLFVAVAAVSIWFLRGSSIPYVSLIGAVCALAGGYPIYREAFDNIVHRRMTMELSMAIAIVAALAIRETFTALVITLFVLAAEILEGLTVGRGRNAIQRLLDLLPNMATVRRGTEWKDCAIEQVRAGEAVLVRPGGRIPVDGTVVSGNSFVDQAAITGESMAVEKLPGAGVYAGTINESGALEIRVERLGRDTTFGKIIEEVERAEKSRAPIQKTADRLAGYLVYFALGAAALTFLITHNIRSTISVVIVAGACGIAAGTPLAVLGAIGQAAQKGAIIKGGLYLEVLSRVDTVILDKTGTLSYGSVDVLEIQPAFGVSEEKLLVAAAIAESRSEHPVGKALLNKARELNYAWRDPDQFEYAPGKGVIAHLDGSEIVVGSRQFLLERGIGISAWTPDPTGSEIGVAASGQFLGAIRIGDTLRPEAIDAISALKSLGLRTVLLTGDVRTVAESAAKVLGVDELGAEMLPSQKVDRVMKLIQEGHTVVMVGDGINDAPALMQASVGVAMGSGTDVARESANVVLIGNDLSKFVDTIRIARQCRRIILQNFTGTLVVDGIGIVLAGFGLLNPLLAALIHVTSELAFILNSTRLIPSQRRRQAVLVPRPS
ncbi:MAG TPA: cation-translocating P-type ATPase [Verrucomicrobiae bacterium]|nr:cation-translocating P-type ATPase [Verrucomicrobiae bacterium]